MTSTEILFTSQELAEFQALYLDCFGEEIDLEATPELASACVSMLYALTTGEDLEVRYKNIALVNSKNNSQDYV